MATARKKTEAGPDETPVLVGSGLGRIAYEAYVEAVGGKSVTGSKLPSWGEQVEDKHSIAVAWCAAAQAVITATIERTA